MAAVPFLRDRDLKYSISGETQAERIENIKNGINKLLLLTPFNFFKFKDDEGMIRYFYCNI